MATVLRPRGATVVFRTVKRPGSILPRGMDTIPALRALHTAPQQCCGHNRVVVDISKSQKNKTPYFPRRPQRFEPLSRQHTHGFAVTLENHRLLSLQRVAPPATLFGVLWGLVHVITHAAAQGSPHVSKTRNFSILSGTPKKFDLRFEGKVSPNVLQSLTCVQYGKCHQMPSGPRSCGLEETVVSRPISGHPEGAIIVLR